LSSFLGRNGVFVSHTPILEGNAEEHYRSKDGATMELRRSEAANPPAESMADTETFPGVETRRKARRLAEETGSRKRC